MQSSGSGMRKLKAETLSLQVPSAAPCQAAKPPSMPATPAEHWARRTARTSGELRGVGGGRGFSLSSDICAGSTALGGSFRQQLRGGLRKGGGRRRGRAQAATRRCGSCTPPRMRCTPPRMNQPLFLGVSLWVKPPPPRCARRVEPLLPSWRPALAAVRALRAAAHLEKNPRRLLHTLQHD